VKSVIIGEICGDKRDEEFHDNAKAVFENKYGGGDNGIRKLSS
jgi:hypothetical protein